MFSPARLLLCVILCSVAMNVANAQTDKPATGSITGRITFDKQPLQGITVALESSAFTEPMSSNRRPITAKTDGDGRYRLMGVVAGQYVVSPRALSYVMPLDRMTGRAGKNINLSDGEQIENIDFTLVKGGVITGKVVDHLDRPVVAQRVNLKRFVAQGRSDSTPVSSQNFYMYETDDRGIYRLYGLQAGRYTLSIGQGGGGAMIVMGPGGGKQYPLTFYPNVRTEQEASVIELTEGGEVTDIDIKLPKPEKSYEAKGRIIDSTTGAPLAGFALSYQKVSSDPTSIGAFGITQNRTNAQGEFVLEGLTTGKYMVAMQSMESATDYYADPVTFEILNSDTEGLEIKAQRGATISGVVVIEGTTDPAILKRVTEVRVMAYPEMPASSSSTPQMPMFNFGGNRATNPDGTFRIAGVRPGKNRLNSSAPGMGAPLVPARIERDGVELPGTIDVVAGDQITGIKVVMVFGSSVIRGQVNVVGGTLSPDIQWMVSAARVGTSSRGGTRPSQVDARGKFVLEGLAPGEYELTLSPMYRPGASPATMPKPVRQKVTVGTGEVTVTMTLDLSEKKEGQQ